MNNLVEQYEKEQITKLIENKQVPEFQSGDTVKVTVRVIDGTTERLQAYEGVVIARRNKGITSSFVVRRVSHGEGVERRFMLYSPIINKIEVIKRGVVRRAKLYYLRDLSGKAARLKERTNYNSKESSAKKAVVKEEKTPANEKEALGKKEVATKTESDK
ncbi:MAG: 50S ribosomal protein L19 [Rickettsiaceae bacterium]|nr:50S ribosomal protein L19 [Rickettsiaceae bacterium]